MSRSILFILSLIITVSLCTNSLAQDEADTEDFVDRFLPDAEEEADYEALLDMLYQFYQQPINLNKCSREQLSGLQLLSETQLNAFFKYRQKFGKFISIYELQAIPNFTPEVIRQLLPFVNITEKRSSKSLLERMFEEKNKYFFFRYQLVPEQKRGFQKDNNTESQYYLGDAARLLYRLRISHSKDFSLGFTLEKDAGEAITWSPNNKTFLADFISYHFTLYNQGKLKAISLGDYQLQFGQGLLLAGGFQMGKGTEIVQGIRRSTRGIIPFASTAEFGFLRGIAASYELLKNTELTAFFSNKNIDATIQLDEAGHSYASSIINNGLHRNSNEVAKKGRLTEMLTGYHLRYKSANLELGTTTTLTRFSVPIQRNPSIYNQFAFNGNSIFNVGMNYSYYWNNFSFFGEGAISNNTGFGLITGFLAGFGRHFELAFLVRNYNREFQSLHGNALSEGTTANNEKSIYWGIKILPTKKWTISAYYDSFQFPWLRFQADAPSGGYEYLGKVTFKPNKQLLVYAQYRFENRSRNLKDNITKIDFVVPVKRSDFRFNIDYKPAK
ncbi:MAG: helix-hairpin-helix domain-containing protein, partial [Bacteroidota bacterium]